MTQPWLHAMLQCSQAHWYHLPARCQTMISSPDWRAYLDCLRLKADCMEHDSVHKHGRGAGQDVCVKCTASIGFMNHAPGPGGHQSCVDFQWTGICNADCKAQASDSDQPVNVKTMTAHGHPQSIHCNLTHNQSLLQKDQLQNLS